MSMTYREPGHNHDVNQACYPELCTGHEHWTQLRAKAESGPQEEREGAVGEVIDRRVQVYGEPVEGFRRIAEVWSGILGVHVNPVDVPLCMIGMKMVRAHQMPDYSDNSDDIEGYLDIFRKIVGDDMIHARTVNEFIEKKWPTIQMCGRHGGRWGDDPTCEACTTEDGKTRDEDGSSISSIVEHPRWVHADGTACYPQPVEVSGGQEYMVVDSYPGGPVIGGLCPNEAHD